MSFLPGLPNNSGHTHKVNLSIHILRRWSKDDHMTATVASEHWPLMGMATPKPLCSGRGSVQPLSAPVTPSQGRPVPPPPRRKHSGRKIEMVVSELRGSNFETNQISKIGGETTYRYFADFMKCLISRQFARNPDSRKNHGRDSPLLVISTVTATFSFSKISYNGPCLL